MVGFQRVLYLDSDTLAVGDAAPLLTDSTKPFAAIRDWENGKVRDHFNMGVASLAPNLTEFQRLDNFRLTKRDYRLEMAEQGLLNAVYGKDFEELPFKFNSNLAAMAQDRSFWNEHRLEARIIHYTWIKPFHYQRTANGNLKECTGECMKCVDALDDWWRLFDEMKLSRRSMTTAHVFENMEFYMLFFLSLAFILKSRLKLVMRYFNKTSRHVSSEMSVV